MFMNIRGISSFIKQGHRHSFRGTGITKYFWSLRTGKATKLSSTCPIVSYNVVSIISRRVGAAIIVGKLETCSPRRAGQGVSDPARAWNSSRDKIDRGDR